MQEQPVRVERRLAAILAADVAAYSRLMHNDEEATHAKLTGLLANIVRPAIVEHGGRIVKNTGDGFLAEFSSAVEAVRAATQFQSRTHELTSDDPEESRVRFRVGINVGDVIVEPHDIFGDDVNVAARLEGIAEPGGICVSASVYAHVGGKVAIEFADLGDQKLKNISRPVRAYAIVWEEASGVSLSLGGQSDALSGPHLSIVVLPFANLSGAPEQEYFVDGVTESLTTDLSRISGLFVIGRHTAFTYKGKAIDLKQIGRELKVRYALEGSVQRSESRLRINVQLADAGTGNHLWAERFDKPMADLFDMQDEIVAHIANALDAQLAKQEARRSERSPLPSSMDLYFQGKALMYKGWIPENLAQARSKFERALALDPENVGAMVGIPALDVIVSMASMTDDSAALLGSAEARVLKVLSLAPNHAFAHLTLGSVLTATNRAVQGIAEFERALVLDRNLAEAHASIGFAKILTGRCAETEAHLDQAFRLSPRDIFAHRWMMWMGFAKLQLGADIEALGWFRRSIEANRNIPLAHFSLAVGLAMLGSIDQAKSAARAGFELDPSFCLRRFRDSVASDNPTYLMGRERFYQGLRIAGVPDG
ncbi:TolB-like protein/class 3 adenylate cyclase/Tfp pilus assembly protein PilF [Bradyrhizobium sp. USDA 10063]